MKLKSCILILIFMLFISGCGSNTTINPSVNEVTIQIEGDNTVYRTSEESQLYSQGTRLSIKNTWLDGKDYTHISIYIFNVATEKSELIKEQYYGEKLEYKIADEGYYYIYATYNTADQNQKQFTILTDFIENLGTENLINEDAEDGIIPL